jgi:cellulose biosynthesis protein BcsQ
MAKINLIIAETDSAYLNGLVNYLSANYEDIFRITCFTKREYLEKYINSDRTVDILLIKPEIYYEDISKNFIKSIIILNDNKNINEFKGYHVVKKYQTGERLCKEILDIYNSSNPKCCDEHKLKSTDSNIITLYSPIGGIGKSVIAISTALQLTKLNKKVLYLNLEDLQSTSVFFNCNTCKNTSDLLYFVKERDEKFREVLQSIAMKDEDTGINYLAPVDSVLDIEDLRADDINFMLSKLIEANIYNYIIIDLSSRFNSIYKVIFEKSSKVIVPVGQGELSCIKIEGLLKQLDGLSNIYFIQNKYRENFQTSIPEALMREKKPIIQKIYYDDELENIDGIKCIKDRAKIFSRGIDELIMKLL